MEEASKENNFKYNKRLKPFAKELRMTMTKAEACLWKYALKGRKLSGYQFRRQRPIHNFIADFMCKELMLVIEVDGVTHLWDEVYEKDVKKQKYLEEVGFTVLRFTDDQVLRDISNVIRALEIYIEDYEEKNPPPSPRQRGTGLE
ncbi:MAG: DUF559 domain-containing protein [Bacteroidales bacterium]|nr:DUF559 domain-containing protein [Bacteroidales bacterium]